MAYTNPVFAGWRTSQGEMRGPNQTSLANQNLYRDYNKEKDMRLIDARRKAAQAAVRGQRQSQRPYTALSTISGECQQRLQQLQREIDEKNETIKRISFSLL